MLEVKLAVRSGHNVIEAAKLKSSISRKPNEKEPWFLLDVNDENLLGYKLIGCLSCTVVVRIAQSP